MNNVKATDVFFHDLSLEEIQIINQLVDKVRFQYLHLEDSPFAKFGIKTEYDNEVTVYLDIVESGFGSIVKNLIKQQRLQGRVEFIHYDFKGDVVETVEYNLILSNANCETDWSVPKDSMSETIWNCVLRGQF